MNTTAKYIVKVYEGIDTDVCKTLYANSVERDGDVVVVDCDGETFCISVHKHAAIRWYENKDYVEQMIDVTIDGATVKLTESQARQYWHDRFINALRPI